MSQTNGVFSGGVGGVAGATPMIRKLETVDVNAMPMDSSFFKSYLSTTSNEELMKIVTDPNLSAKKTEAIAEELLKRLHGGQRVNQHMPYGGAVGGAVGGRSPYSVGPSEEDAESDLQNQIESYLKELESGRDVEGRKLTEEELNRSKAELARLLKQESIPEDPFKGRSSDAVFTNCNTSI